METGCSLLSFWHHCAVVTNENTSVFSGKNEENARGARACCADSNNALTFYKYFYDVQAKCAAVNVHCHVNTCYICQRGMFCEGVFYLTPSILLYLVSAYTPPFSPLSLPRSSTAADRQQRNAGGKIAFYTSCKTHRHGRCRMELPE